MYRIENHQLTIEINPIGAEIFRIFNKHNGLNYLWSAHPDYWSRTAPILFPVVGKLKNDEYFFEQESYEMKQHGFARDLPHRLVQSKENEMSFELTADKETRASYPFSFKLLTTYTLVGNKISIEYKVYNCDRNEMPFSIGGHPAFNCPINPELKFSDYHVLFNSSENLNCIQLSNGLLSNSTYNISLVNNKLALNYNLFENDALVIEKPTDRKMILESTKSPEKIIFNFDNVSYFGIWTKAGAPFLCLEPWHGVADHVDSTGNILNKKGIKVITPGASFSMNFEIEII